ncbi:MAG: ATP-binding protein [Rudaea sp.]
MDMDLRFVIDQLSTGVAILDGQGKLLHINPAMIDAIGVTGWRDRPLAVVGPAGEDLSPIIERVREDGVPRFLRDIQLRTRGTPLRCDVAVSVTADGMLLELHALGPQEFADSSPRISQSLRGLAHEIKNPLAGLRGAAQLLHRRIAEPDLQRLAAMVIAEADRLAALADQLLQPGGKPHLSAVNLHEVAERARALMTAEVEPQLQLERDYDPSFPSFFGDADRILQLTLNLLRNAAQASARSITVRTRAEHGAVIAGKSVRTALRMDVIDDGAGVPAHLRDTLFLPLVSGRDEGTGLGLAVAQEIAQEHGGQITFHSQPGHTVFSLLLPLDAKHG